MDDLVHRGGVLGFFQGLAEFLFVKELGDVRESVEMFLELALRDQWKVVPDHIADDLLGAAEWIEKQMKR